MELKSTINDTWKLCTLVSLFGCFLLLLFLNQTHQTLTLSAARNNTMLELAPLGDLIPSTSIIQAPEPQPEPELQALNLTFDHMEKLATLGDDLIPASTSMFQAREPDSEPKPELKPEREPGPEREALNATVSQIKKLTNERDNTKCNMFEGRWVYKPEEEPRYELSQCPFLEEKMSCRANGRPDLEYEKWRWEAKDCDIPLFNGTDMLERLRNKRMIIVGDSLNRNKWESLACLLYSSIPSSRAQVDAKSPAYKVFKAKDYNTTVEFFWSPFLTEFNENHESGKKVLVLDKLSASSRQWRGADVMVFNSGHWWIHLGKFKAWDLLQYKGELVEKMPIELAYERGMRTWATWIKNNVDPKKTTVFFRSISPEHKAKQWCYNATQPIMDESYKSLFPKSLIEIIERLITKEMSNLQIKYLNITKLSSYRRDAHPSVYRSWQWKIYTTKYQRLIPSFADCSHWCLPGLPDTWNRLLYASLFFDTSGDMSSS